MGSFNHRSPIFPSFLHCCLSPQRKDLLLRAALLQKAVEAASNPPSNLLLIPLHKKREGNLFDEVGRSLPFSTASSLCWAGRVH